MDGSGYYLDLWRYRKMYFLIPALLVAVIAVVLAFKLPPIYQSTSTILIEEQQIPPEFVRATVTGFADHHIQILNQQILSRSRLQEIVDKFNLYAEMRQKSTREEIIDKMRKDIEFKTISAKVHDKKRGPADTVTIAFTISYQGKSPTTVQQVAGTLATLYLEQNLKYREAQAQSTTVFLQAESKQLQEQIADLGGKIAAYKEQYGPMLPELQQFNLSQAERLETEVKNTENALRTAENQKVFLEGLLASAMGVGDGAQLGPGARLRALEVQLSDLRAKFSEEHPDIQKALREKVHLEKTLSDKGGGDFKRQKLQQLQAELAQKQATYGEQHPDVRKLQSELASWRQEADKGRATGAEITPDNPTTVNLTAQIQSVKNDINTLRQQRQNMQEKLRIFRQRLENGPKVEQPYLALQRDYHNAHTKYQEVSNKLQEARIGEGLEEHQKGGKFTLIEPAAYPEKPFKPNRKMILGMGLALACVAGGMITMGVDKRDHGVRNVEELTALTAMAPLAIIARIETPFDVADKQRRRRLWWSAAGACLGLGVLAVHFFYMDLYILWARLARMIEHYW